jgi:hypothetical protein
VTGQDTAGRAGVHLGVSPPWPPGTGADAPRPGRMATWGLACSLAALLPVLLRLADVVVPVPLVPGALQGLTLLASPVLAITGVALSGVALWTGSGRRGRALAGVLVGSTWLVLLSVLLLLLAAAV